MTRAAVLAALLLAPAARAAELDSAKIPRLFDTHFGRYGHQPTRTITREGPKVRFRLPAVKGVGQTGLYSYMALAGDFEITAPFELVSLPAPSTGYGASVGLAVDTDGPAGMVALTRTVMPGQGVSGYTITRGRPGDVDMKYESEHFPASAKAGKLVLRREKGELICLAADGPKETPRELARVPFTAGTVRKVRLYADPGGSPTAVDARLGPLTLRADEITGGIPEREAGGGLLWWVAGGTLLAAIGGAVYWHRRRQQE